MSEPKPESKSSAPQEELQAALEDVRRIRDLLDEMGEQNPMRVLMRPLFQLGYAFAPALFLYGVLSQLVLDAEGATVVGFSKVTALCMIGFSLMFFASITKAVVAWRAAKHKGINFRETISTLMSVGYPHLIFPVLLMIGFFSAFLVQIGHAHQIAGTFIMMYGLIMLLMPLRLPVPDLRGLGYLLMLSGGLSLFVLPAYPFCKVGVMFGIACLWMGYVGHRGAKDTG